VAIKWYGLAGALPFALAATSAHSAEPLVLNPSTDWVLDFAEERCSLVRGFGEGDDAVRFQIDSFGQNYNYRVLVAGKPISIGNGPTGELRYRLTSDSELRPKIDTLEGRSGEAAALAFHTAFGPHISAETMEGLSAEERLTWAIEYRDRLPAFHETVAAIDLHLRGNNVVRLELGPMGPALKAPETCIADLQAHWGLNPEQQRQLIRPPVPKEATIRRLQRQYPADLALEGVNAFLPVRLLVDAEGRPTDCVVQVESVDEKFKKSVCAGMARGFEPALDKDGQPVAALFTTSVIYIAG